MAVSGTGTSRANFGDLLEPVFRKIFFDQYQQIPQIYSQIFHVIETDRRDLRDTSVSGFGQLVETTEGGPITYEDPVNFVAAYSREIVRKSFKLLETLFETISSQIREIKKSLRGSETIIRTSFWMMV